MPPLLPLALSFNWQIDFGQILTLCGIVAAVLSSLYVSQLRLKYIERDQHETKAALTHAIADFNDRFDRHEDITRGIAGDVQRLIGITDRRLATRTGSSHG